MKSKKGKQRKPARQPSKLKAVDLQPPWRDVLALAEILASLARGSDDSPYELPISVLSLDLDPTPDQTKRYIAEYANGWLLRLAEVIRQAMEAGEHDLQGLLMASDEEAGRFLALREVLTDSLTPDSYE